MSKRPLLLLVGALACLGVLALIDPAVPVTLGQLMSGQHPKAARSTTYPIPAPSASHAVPTALATKAATRIMIRFGRGVSAGSAAAVEASLGLHFVRAIPDLRVRIVSAPSATEGRSALASLKKRRDVELAEIDGYVQATDVVPNDPYWSNEWSPLKTHAPTAWSLATGTTQVVIADVDSGVTPVADLPTSRILAGYNFVGQSDTLNTGGTADTTDDNGHGTWVAGVAAAETNDGIGVADYCWKCSILPVKVLDSSGNGLWSNVASGVTWAADHGAAVINLSFGATSGSSTVQSAIDYAHSKGCVIVAAAGNNSSSSPFYPAAYSGVVGVAATTNTDTLTSYSDYGSWVTVAAPGDNWSVAMQNGYYVEFQGTSSASPVVAGIAALAFSYAPSSSNTQVEQAMMTSAVNVGSIVKYGRVDAYATLLALGATPTTVASPSPTASPSAGPSPSPSPVTSPSPASSTQTLTFSGSLNPNDLSRSFAVTVGAGTTAAKLTFTKCSSLTLTLDSSTGTAVGSSSGPSAVTLSTNVAAGTYTYVVGGGRCSFSLTVSAPAP